MKRIAPATPTSHGLRDAVIVAVALLFVLAIQYRDVLRVPFINDDYLFLDKTRRASFLSLFGLRDLAFHWYRPWSRELHYWTLQRVFGAREPGFHAVSLALWLGAMLAHFAFVRRAAGPRAAWIALAGGAAMSAWAVPLIWIAGVQDLWMLAFALVALLALARGWIAASAIATALALLSKETAAVVPLVATLYAWIRERRSPAGAVARTAPHWIVLAAWALVHPAIGGRLWHAPGAGAPAAAPSPGAASVVLRTLLAPLNLDVLPAPDDGWGFAARAIPAMLVLGLLALLAGRATKRQRDDSDRRATLAFGAAWTIVGWLPLFAPGLGWHSYYGLFGALGAWMVAGVMLASRPAIAAILIAACAGLRAADAHTPSRDWGAEWYQRRAAEFLAYMRRDLLTKQPTVPPHSRLFFTGVPSNVGFITEGAPALRVWYGDTTISGGLYADYRARARDRGRFVDYFFRYDSTAGWQEIASVGGEDELLPGRDPAHWKANQLQVAAVMARAKDWGGAANRYQLLAGEFPDSAEYALNAGICHEMMRDSSGAVAWYRRAAAIPGAPPDVVQFARQFELRFRSMRE